MYDILIRNGLVLDGTGGPGFHAQVAVKDGKIVRVARMIEGEAKQVIDAAGRVVTPGFIDSHSHSDLKFAACPQQTEKVEQGITTVIGGQCGGSVCGEHAAAFLDEARNAQLGVNMGLLIGHGTLRRQVVGLDNRAATPEEQARMEELLAAAMEHGAMGVSFGLIYAPGCYADTQELIGMARVAARYGGVAAVHLRSEGERMVRAVDEFITVVRASGVRGIISHHKAGGLSENWGKVHNTMAIVEKANGEGLDIFFDAYPYAASSSTFSGAFIPNTWRSGGVEAMLARMEDPEQVAQIRAAFYAKFPNMDWMMITVCPGAPEYEGLRVGEIAALRGQDEFDAALDVVRISKGAAKCVFFSICEQDVQAVLANPRTMIGTDGSVGVEELKSYHPRVRGTFPRAIGRYVRQLGVVTLPEMIRKMTSMPAAVYGLAAKGLVREGMDADLCIFDPERICDRATYTEPSLRNEGLDYVIIGGKVAAINAVATGALGGKMLYRRNER